MLVYDKLLVIPVLYKLQVEPHESYSTLYSSILQLECQNVAFGALFIYTNTYVPVAE